MIDTKRVQSRVKGRQVASTVIELAQSELASLDNDGKAAFNERLVQEYIRPIVEDVGLALMTDAEAMAFENRHLPYLWHSGKLVRDVRYEDLATWTDCKTFLRHLTRFLRSNYARRNQTSEDHDC